MLQVSKFLLCQGGRERRRKRGREGGKKEKERKREMSNVTGQ